MESKTIQEVLQGLDAQNFDNWTPEGLPRVDIVRSLTGDMTLTRETIDAAMPGFVRPGFEAQKAPAVQAPWAVQTPASTSTLEPAAPAAPAAPTPPAEPPAQAVQAQQATAAVATSVAVDDLKEQLAKATEVVQQRQQDVEDAKKELANAQKAEDEIKDKLTLLEPSSRVQVTHTIQAYLERQKENLEMRAQRMKLIRESGINLKELAKDLKSPIDAVRARKTGR